jgi:histone deacetylase 6
LTVLDRPLTKCYYYLRFQNSLVIVSRDHYLWSRLEEGKGLSKRYGNVKATHDEPLHQMLLTHRDEIWRFIEQRIGSDDDETEDEEGVDD